MKKFFLFFLFLLALLNANSQAGHLDPSFNDNGYNFVDFKKGNFFNEYGSQVLLTSKGYVVALEINGYTSLARYKSGSGSLDNDFGFNGFTEAIDISESKVALQTDGKIVIAGYSYNTATGSYDFSLARYNSNGTLDKGFGNNGKQTTDFGDYDVATSIAIQSDGKIVLAGNAYNTGAGNYDFALVRYKTNGSLDNSFDGDGKVTTDFLGDFDKAYAVLIQSNGKIVAAGQAYNPGANNYDFALARYNTDGSPDNSFDADSKQTTDIAGGNDYIYAAVIQNDDKIVAAGFANSSGSDGDFALARYNTDGSPDNSFDSDGKLTTDFFSKYDYATAVAIQSNGKIVAVGGADSATLNTDYNFALARYNTDGSLDNSFSGDGKQATDFFGNNDYAYSVVIQSDGKIVAAGYASNVTTESDDIALTRYKPNGDLDNSFDNDGKLTSYYAAVETIVTAVAVQKDGKIVVAGYTYNSSVNNIDFALARYKANGDLDNSFDQDGRQVTDFFGDVDGAFAIALQKDGKIVLAGTAYNSATEKLQFALVRYGSDGKLDKSFDNDGKQVTPLLDDDALAYGVAIQSNGKIVTAGQAYNSATGNIDFALARYNTNGSLDKSFDGDGKQSTDFFGDVDYATSVAIQSDGKIVAAGRAYNSNTGSDDFALARYNTDGSPDNSFDGDGKQTTDFFGASDYAAAVAIQSNGKIVAAGQAFNISASNYDFALARYNTDGSPDNTFDADGKQIIDFFGNNGYGTAVGIQNDGKIVVAGPVDNSISGSEFGVARLKSDGSQDNSFDGDGKHTTTIPGYATFATSLSIYNNKVYVGGYGNSFMQRGVVAAYLLGNAGKNAGIEVSGGKPLATGQDFALTFTIKAQPNPSANYFKLSLQSESNSQATVRVIDVLGKLIEIKANVTANSTLQLGHNYRPGIYNVEIIQGNKKAVVRLIKQ